MKCPWRSLSVFFPVFNEARALPGVLENALRVLESMELSAFEIIVVDDGSTDETSEIAQEAAARDSRIRVVRHIQNQGYGAALSSGFAAARYEWVAYTDGDGQFDLADIKKFYEPSTQVEVVLGFRRKRNDHWGRKLNAWIWGELVKVILRLRVRDVDCGFKLFRTQNVRDLGKLEAQGAVISAELLMKLKSRKLAWQEVEVEHYSRQGGAPTGANLSVIWRALRELMNLRRKRAL